MAKKKVTVRTDNSEWKAPKKRRKPRKPMTEEQRAAAAERLAKAREKKAAADPNYGKSGIAECLHNLPEDYPLHPKKVKEWIKTQKDLASSERKQKRLGNKNANPDIHEAYVRNMKTYLRNGDWVDSFYGEHQEKVVRYRCIALAYDKNGDPKRNVGTFYPDIGIMWTQEMQDEERGISRGNDERPKRKRRTTRKRGKRAVEKQGSKTA